MRANKGSSQCNSEENQAARAKKRYPGARSSSSAKRSRADRPAATKAVKRQHAAPEVTEPLITKQSLRTVGIVEPQVSTYLDVPSAQAPIDSAPSPRSPSPPTPAQLPAPLPIKNAEMPQEFSTSSVRFHPLQPPFPSAEESPLDFYPVDAPAHHFLPWPTPTSDFNSPPLFPVPFPFFEQPHQPASVAPWPHLPTPKSEPLNPHGTTSASNYFPQQSHATFDHFLPPFVPLVAPQEQDPTMDSTEAQSERRRLQSWLSGVDTSHQLPNPFDQSLVMFGAPMDAAELDPQLYPRGGESAALGLQGLF